MTLKSHALCLAGGLILSLTFVFLYQQDKADYIRNTPLVVRQQREKLVQEVQQLPVGTFIKQSDGTLVMVQKIGSRGDVTLRKIDTAFFPGDRDFTYVPVLARNAEQIIRPDGPTWCKAAQEFLIP
jgi:hypothetical protein